MSTLESNKDVVRRFLDEAVAGEDYDVAREILAEDYERHEQVTETDEGGPEPFIEMMQRLHGGFPDADWTVGEMIAEGDLVAFEGSMTGTHDGEFMDVEPTGKSISIRGNAMHRVRDGQIVETWATWDMLDLLQQLEQIEAKTP